MFRIHLRILSIFLFQFVLITTHAQTITWTGLGDGTNWSDMDNWTPIAVPSMDDEVIITSAINPVIIDGNFSAKAKSVEINGYMMFEIKSGSSLLIKGQNSGICLKIDDLSSVTNRGQLFVQFGSRGIWLEGSFENYKELYCDLNTLDNILVFYSGNFINHESGTISIGGGTRGIFNYSSFTNCGDIDIAYCTEFAIEVFENGEFLNKSCSSGNGNIDIYQQGNGIFVNEGAFVNKSTLNFSNVVTSIEVVDSFYNTGDIYVINDFANVVITVAEGACFHHDGTGNININKGFGIKGISGNGRFISTSTGEIVSRTQFNRGIDIDSFINESTILEIDSCGTAIWNKNYYMSKQFTQIRVSSQYGVYNEGEFINSSVLTISETLGSGLFNFDGILHNKFPGTIEINTTNGTGFNTKGNGTIINELDCIFKVRNTVPGGTPFLISYGTSFDGNPLVDIRG